MAELHGSWEDLYNLVPDMVAHHLPQFQLSHIQPGGRQTDLSRKSAILTHSDNSPFFFALVLTVPSESYRFLFLTTCSLIWTKFGSEVWQYIP